jgi:hypothetical protein
MAMLSTTLAYRMVSAAGVEFNTAQLVIAMCHSAKHALVAATPSEIIAQFRFVKVGRVSEFTDVVSILAGARMFAN